MKKPQEEQKPMTNNLSKFMTRIRNSQNSNQKGSFEFSLGDLFKCVCCIHSGISYEEKRLNEINESLQQINKHLSLLDRFEGVVLLIVKIIIKFSHLKLFLYYKI